MLNNMLTVTDCFKESDLPEEDEVARSEYGGYQRTVRSQRMERRSLGIMRGKLLLGRQRS